MEMIKTIPVFLTGAGGQLGVELQNSVPENIQLYPFSEEQLDITKKSDVLEILENIQPDWIINAAAYTAVDNAEREPKKAFEVNHKGAENIAVAADKIGAKMIQISTDYVFDGNIGRPYRTDDTPNPINVYGESKYRGENAVKQVLGDNSLILRTSWLYSGYGNNFLNTMLRLIKEKDEIIVVCDQIGTPTSTRSLSKAIWMCIEKKVSGIHHWTDAGVASWYDFSVVIKDIFFESMNSKRDVHILPVNSQQYFTLSKRPYNSVLDKYNTWGLLGVTSKHWVDSLKIEIHRLIKSNTRK